MPEKHDDQGSIEEHVAIQFGVPTDAIERITSAGVPQQQHQQVEENGRKQKKLPGPSEEMFPKELLETFKGEMVVVTHFQASLLIEGIFEGTERRDGFLYLLIKKPETGYISRVICSHLRTTFTVVYSAEKQIYQAIFSSGSLTYVFTKFL